MHAQLPIQKVLNDTTSRSTLTKATLTLLDSTSEVRRVELGDGEADWVTISLEKSLEFLCRSAPEYEKLIENAIKSSGARIVIYCWLHGAPRGGNRSARR